MGETLVAHKIGFDSDTSYWAVYGLRPGDRVSLGVRSSAHGDYRVMVQSLSLLHHDPGFRN